MHIVRCHATLPACLDCLYFNSDRLDIASSQSYQAQTAFFIIWVLVTVHGNKCATCTCVVVAVLLLLGPNCAAWLTDLQRVLSSRRKARGSCDPPCTLLQRLSSCSMSPRRGCAGLCDMLQAKVACYVLPG